MPSWKWLRHTCQAVASLVLLPLQTMTLDKHPLCPRLQSQKATSLCWSMVKGALPSSHLASTHGPCFRCHVGQSGGRRKASTGSRLASHALRPCGPDWAEGNSCCPSPGRMARAQADSRQANRGPGALLHPVLSVEGATHCFSSRTLDRPPTRVRPRLGLEDKTRQRL